MTANLLAIETSTLTASVALLCEGRVVGESNHTSVAHSSLLMPAIDQLLRDHMVQPLQLTGVAIGLGPGSFTGLRIGMATAKGIAYACGAPLFGVSSLAALAYAMTAPAGFAPAARIAMLDARRNEVFVAVFDHDCRPLSDEVSLAPEAVAEFVAAVLVQHQIQAEQVLIASDAFADYEALRSLAFARSDVAVPTAAAVAALVAKQQGHDLTFHGTPVYVRKAEAEINFPDGVPGALRKSSTQP